MSIISAADASWSTLLAELLLVAVILLPGLLVVWWTRSYRSHSVVGPLRIPDHAPMWPVPVAVVVAFAGWMGSAMVYSVVIGVRAAASGTTQPVNEADLMAMLTPIDFVVLAAVTPIVGLIAGVVFLLLVRPAALGWLGLAPGRLPRGLALGALAAVFAVPMTMLAGGITEGFYKLIDFQHPAEHELLKFMKDASERWVQISAIAAAVLVAPLMEEFLFRGLLQTSLMTWFARFGRPKPAVLPPPFWPPHGTVLGYQSAPATAQGGTVMPPPLPAIGSDPNAPAFVHPGREGLQTAPEGGPAPQLPAWSPVGYALPTDPSPEAAPDASNRKRWPSWLAIVITSVLFAVIHPLWTAPIIFVLAVIIGYVYERTGNLWAAIALHAIFNTTSTTLYLLGIGQS